MGSSAATLVVQFRCAPADVETFDDLLWRHGTGGIAQELGDDGQVLVSAGFSPAQVGAVRAELEAAGVAEVTLVDPDAASSVDEWRRHAEPHRVGRFWFRLPEHPPAPSATLVDLTIEPGRAFGSGSHESTRLALALLDDLLEGPDRVGQTPRVADVGCGTGVLGIASLLAGAQVLSAVDIDDDAVAVTRRNLEMHGLIDRVETLAVGSTELLATGVHEVVVANLTAGVLVPLGSELVRLVRPGGRLMVAGLLTSQRDAVVEALQPAVVESECHEGQWQALRLRQP